MRYTLASAWTLAILAACILPSSGFPSPGVAGLDKLIHVVLFTGFGALWVRALGPRRTGAVVAAGLAYAVFTELLQTWLPWERSLEIGDMLADGLGVLLGVAAARRAGRFGRNEKSA